MNTHKKEAIRLRKQYVKSSEHDVEFAKGQIVFWNKYLKQVRKYLAQAKSRLKQAEGWSDE